MPRHRRPADRQLACELADGAGPLAEETDDLAPVRVAERVEGIRCR
jgi:hypothetical protein